MAKTTIMGTAPNQIVIMTEDGAFLFAHELDSFDHPHFIVEVSSGRGVAADNARIKATFDNHLDFEFEVLSSGNFITSVLVNHEPHQARIIGDVMHTSVQLYSNEKFVRSISPIKY